MHNEEQLIAVQRMQAYIQDHLTEPITLRQLASAAGYSPWHAASLFAQVTGHAPFAYLRALRLSAAALRLRAGDARVLDVALDFVFDSQEGFTRAFTRRFGLPPGRYAKQSPPIPLFMPEKVHDSYRGMQGGTKMAESVLKPVFVQVMERPARKLMLYRAKKATHYFEYCEETGCGEGAPWPVLCSVKEALYEPVGMWLPDHLIRSGTSLYVHALELPLDYDKPLPEGFELIDLPEALYMIFQGQPYEDDNFQAEVGQVMDFIDDFNPGLYGYAWDPQAAPRFQLAPMGYRGYIEGRPVKALR
jgi:AraC family transcriptional regulator